MKKNISILNGVPIGFVPIGTDNVPTNTVSDRIIEEKLSLQLLDKFCSGNLETFTQRIGNRFPCDLNSVDGRHFYAFSLKSGQVMLHQSQFMFPEEGCYLSMVSDLQHISLWDLFHGISPYKTRQSAAHFFGEESLGYSTFKLSNYHFYRSIFPMPRIQQHQPNVSEEYALQQEVNKIVGTGFPNGIFDHITAFPNNTINNWMVMCFDFDNEINEVVMKVVKIYCIPDGHHFVKSYLPLTHWYSKDIGKPFTATVGLPDKQILFQLSRIAEAETVIVCSSLEAALANQQNNPAEAVAFTAFVCDDHRFDQVDFTPLKGKSVKLLISNHSGMTLAESYLEAQALYEYLCDEIKLEGIGFIQMAVEYPDLADVYDIDALMEAHRRQKPQIIDGSVIEMTETEFADMLPKASAEIKRKSDQSKDKPFWETSDATASTAVETQSVPEKQTDKMILRPFIVGGQITVIESAPGIGKSCLTTALCAQIAGSNAPFLKERCLTRCTPLDNPTRGYKVVYLTFDGDDTAITEHRRDFARDLGKNDGNFIQRDMAGDTIDYKQEGNYNKFVALVDSFRNEGIKDQPVDVLVIDTLLEFAHGSVDKVHLLLRKLLADFPNMAIILIHHLNKAGDSYGGTKGTMLPRVILKLYRTDAQLSELKGRKPTLCDPFTFEVEKFNANKIPIDGESFSLRLDSNNHFIVIDPTYPQDEMRKELIEQYEKRYDLTQTEIGRLFGVSDRAIRGWK